MSEEREQEVEVLPAKRPPLGGGRGRVFDAEGRPERAQVQFRAGCAPPLGRWLRRLLTFAAILGLATWLLGSTGVSHSEALTWLRDGGVSARLAAIAAITLLTPIFLPAGLMAVVPGYAWGALEGTLIALAGAEKYPKQTVICSNAPGQSLRYWRAFSTSSSWRNFRAAGSSGCVIK